MEKINSRLPILDYEMWIENGQKIRQRFYKNPMATEEVVWERSALPISSNTNILLEEMGRRLKNYDIDTPWGEKTKLISKFNDSKPNYLTLQF